MISPEKIRAEIADRLVRVVAPIILLSMLVNVIFIIIIGENQYHRLPPTILIIFAIIPAWILARKGRPRAAAAIIASFICITILAAMVLSGGIRAPGFIASLSCVTIFIVLYGARGGILFSLAAISAGGLFIWLDSKGMVRKVDAPPDIYFLTVIGIFLVMQVCFVLIPVHMMFKTISKSRKQRDELKQAVFEKQQSQKEMQSILNKTPDIIYRLTPDGEITFISHAIARYGFEQTDLINTPIMDLVHPHDRKTAQRQIHERRSGDRGSKDIEVRILHKSGLNKTILTNGYDANWSTFLVSSEGIYTKDENDNPVYIGVQGIARDISEKKQYESQVMRLAAVVEQASEDVVITDSEGFISYVNPRFERLTGYSKNEVIGKKPTMFKSGMHDKAFYAELWATIEKGNTWNGKIWNKIKDGSLILQDVTITPIFDASGSLTGYASVRRDITEQENFEERLKQSQKMEAIGTLAGGIAHDFNNILGAIIGYSELTLIELEENHPVTKYANRILKAGGRAKDLVKQILLFSRQTKQEKMPVKITTLAKEVIKLLKATLPANIEIRTSFSDESCLALSDPSQIHQIFMNLCTNAAHAMKEKGGMLAIHIDEVELDRDAVRNLPNLSPGLFVKLRISDTGHGIPADILEKVFDPFFTTKSREEGTGMGLSVVYGIVEGHGGAITVESQTGHGTLFSIFLPALKSEKEEHSLLEDSIPKGNETILFVDDEPALIDFSKAILERLGYKVDVFSDSRGAWEAFQEDPARFDLVVTDKNMPGLSGLELSKKIISLKPDIPIIMCTGFSEEITAREAQAIGIRKILNKPIISKDIGEAIREALDNQATAV